MNEANLIFLDFETYFNRKEKYDLRELSILEYIRDPRFKVHGVGINAYYLFNSTKEEIQKFASWSERIVVGHNVKFDGFILKNHFGIQPKSWIDTMAMAKAVLGNKVEDFSLATLAKYYGLPEKGTMKTDGIRDLIEEQHNELAEYCMHDVWLCREIYKRLAPEFPENQYPLMSQTIQMFVEPKLELDAKLLEQTVREEKERKERVILSTGIKPEIFSSNQKFAELLEIMGYEVPEKKSPKTGKTIPALALGDPDFLDLLESEDEELKRLCEARKEAKSTLMETRSENLLRISKTGKWCFDVGFSGAVQTHRYSGSNGAGGNPQNFTACRDKKAHALGHQCPGILREAVKTPPGYLLIVGDFANIEMRLVAYLSGDRGLINAIEKQEDVYCSFASAFYRRKISKDDTNERRFGKTAILGLGYGMGATKFQKTVRLQTRQKITIEDARKAVNLYRALYPKVPALWKRLDNQIPWLLGKSLVGGLEQPFLFLTNSISLPSGLKIQYPNLRQDGKEWVYDGWGKKGEKVPVKLYGGKLLENICQALSGELCKEAMIKFGDKVVGQVHDEILLISDTPEDDRAELQHAMEQAPSWLPQIKLEAEVGYGKTWAEAKKAV